MHKPKKNASSSVFLSPQSSPKIKEAPKPRAAQSLAEGNHDSSNNTFMNVKDDNNNNNTNNIKQDESIIYTVIKHYLNIPIYKPSLNSYNLSSSQSSLQVTHPGSDANHQIAREDTLSTRTVPTLSDTDGHGDSKGYFSFSISNEEGTLFSFPDYFSKPSDNMGKNKGRGKTTGPSPKAARGAFPADEDPNITITDHEVSQAEMDISSNTNESVFTTPTKDMGERQKSPRNNTPICLLYTSPSPRD